VLYPIFCYTTWQAVEPADTFPPPPSVFIPRDRTDMLFWRFHPCCHAFWLHRLFPLLQPYRTVPLHTYHTGLRPYADLQVTRLDACRLILDVPHRWADVPEPDWTAPSFHLPVTAVDWIPLVIWTFWFRRFTHLVVFCREPRAFGRHLTTLFPLPTTTLPRSWFGLVVPAAQT